MALVQEFEWIFHIILIILAVMLVLCLIRAVIGPRIADRLVSVNMMGTMIMCIIVILGVIMDEGYLADIALIYAMISFLAVVVLTKVYTGVYLEQKVNRENDAKRKIIMDIIDNNRCFLCYSCTTDTTTYWDTNTGRKSLEWTENKLVFFHNIKTDPVNI